MISWPGRSHRWKVLPRIICAPVAFNFFGGHPFSVAFFFRRHPFYGAVGANRHKTRRFHYATIKDQAATACATVGGVQFKFHFFSTTSEKQSNVLNQRRGITPRRAH